MKTSSDTSSSKSTITTDPITVVIETTLGSMEAELYPDKAPITVENFMSYAEEGYYDGTIFHRVIADFMIQGGGFDTEMVEKPTKDAIKNEADNGLKNEAGTLAMARTMVVDSATSQFFTNTKANTFLDNGQRDFGYAVFGKITAGNDVLEAIENVKTSTQKIGSGSHQNVPVEMLEIISIKKK